MNVGSLVDPWGSGIGKGINSFLHPEKAFKKASGTLQENFNKGLGYQTPYWQHGLDQYPGLMEAENNLLHPEELFNKWAQGYEESPYAKNLLQENTAQGMDLASQMGLSGSSAALNNIQTGAGTISAEQRQNYLKDLMEKYMEGIGLGKNLYGVGAQTGANIGQQYGELGQNLAQLKYNEHAAPGHMFENILRLGANAAGGNPYGS